MALGPPFWDPWGTVFVFFEFWGTSGLHFGTHGLNLGTLGPILVTFSTLGRGPGPLWPLLGERLEKGTKNDRKWEPK